MTISKPAVAIALLTFTALYVGRPEAAAQQGPAAAGVKQWEYIVIRKSTVDGFQKELNEAGKEGWEVCGFGSSNEAGVHAYAILKKPVR